MFLLPTLVVIPCITDSYIDCADRLWRMNQTDRLWRIDQTNKVLQAAVVEVLVVVAAVEITDKLWRMNQPDRLWRMNQTNKALQAAVVEVLVVVAAVELTEEEIGAAVSPAEVRIIQQTLNVDLSSQGMFTF
jgi:hypothetical protein